MIIADLVCGFPARSASKPHTIKNQVPLCRGRNAPTA
jgi:hypothetical protein